MTSYLKNDSSRNICSYLFRSTLCSTKSVTIWMCMQWKYTSVSNGGCTCGNSRYCDMYVVAAWPWYIDHFKRSIWQLVFLWMPRDLRANGIVWQGLKGFSRAIQMQTNALLWLWLRVGLGRCKVLWSLRINFEMYSEKHPFSEPKTCFCTLVPKRVSSSYLVAT